MSTETKGEDHWDAVSFALSSHYRVSTLRTLLEQPNTPSNLSDETGEDVGHISRALGELRNEELVELLVSEDRRKGRIYGLTEKGEEIAHEMESRGGA